MRPVSVARLELVAAALLFSTGGAAIKSCTMSSWQVAGFRSLIAALTIPLLVPAARTRWTRGTLAVAAAYAVTLITFVRATKLTTAANAIFLQSTAPLWLLVLAPWLLREPLRRRDLPILAAIAVGMVFLFRGESAATETASDPALGNTLAAASGLSWAFTVLGFRWLARAGRPAGPAVVAGNVAAFAICLPFAWPPPLEPVTNWLWLIYLGVAQIGLAYICLTHAIHRIRALEASLILLVEPVFNPIWTFLVVGERPGTDSMIGGAIILGATLFLTGSSADESVPATPAPGPD